MSTRRKNPNTGEEWIYAVKDGVAQWMPMTAFDSRAMKEFVSKAYSRKKTATGGLGPKAKKQLARNKQDIEEEYQRSKDEAKYAQELDAKGMSAFKKIPMSAMLESSKLATGIEDISDAIGFGTTSYSEALPWGGKSKEAIELERNKPNIDVMSTLGNLIPKLVSPPSFDTKTLRFGESRGVPSLSDMEFEKNPATSDDYFESMQQRKLDEAAHDEMMAPFHEGAGLSDIIGKGLPYMATGRYLDPLAKATVGKAITKAGSGIKEGAKAAEGFVSRKIKERVAKDGDDMLTRMAREADESFLKPLESKMMGLKNRPDITDPYRGGFAKEAGQAGAVGAAEGGVHYDDSIAGGAISSVIGTTGGRQAAPYVEAMPDANKAAPRELLDWAKEKGVRVLPGVDKNQPLLQNFEGRMRNDDSYMGYMDQIDAANDEVTSKMAAEAMGYKAGEDFTGFTKSGIKDHKQGLKAQYEDLEARSVGKVDKQALTEFGLNIPEDAPKSVHKMYEKLHGMKHARGRTPTGQFTPASFSGKEYKMLRSEIKEHADNAAINNIPEKKYYDGMMDLLDSGMETGVRDMGGEVGVQQWKDLNEKYALTKLMQEKGLRSSDLSVDLDKLGAHFDATDMARVTEGTEQKIGDLHKMAQLNKLVKSRTRSTLNTNDVDSTAAAKQHNVGFLSTPAMLKIPMTARLRANMYTGNNPLGVSYPASTGLVPGMKAGNKTWKASQVGRAMSQGSDMHVDAANTLREILNDEYNPIDDAMSDLLRKAKGIKQQYLD